MEFLIPILALSIPIIAIISHYRVNTQKMEKSDEKTSDRLYELEKQVLELQKNSLQMEKTIRELEDKQEFLTRLLEDENE